MPSLAYTRSFRGILAVLKRKQNHRHYMTSVEKDNYRELESRGEGTIVPKNSYLWPSNICQSFIRVQANSVILLISAPFFRRSFDPRWNRGRSASRFDILVSRRYPELEFRRFFDIPTADKNRQECANAARLDERGGTSPFRNWSQDNSGATVLNIDSIVQAAAASSRSIGRTGYDRVTFLSARFWNWLRDILLGKATWTRVSFESSAISVVSFLSGDSVCLFPSKWD